MECESLSLSLSLSLSHVVINSSRRKVHSIQDVEATGIRQTSIEGMYIIL